MSARPQVAEGADVRPRPQHSPLQHRRHHRHVVPDAAIGDDGVGADAAAPPDGAMAGDRRVGVYHSAFAYGHGRLYVLSSPDPRSALRTPLTGGTGRVALPSAPAAPPGRPTAWRLVGHWWSPWSRLASAQAPRASGPLVCKHGSSPAVRMEWGGSTDQTRSARLLPAAGREALGRAEPQLWGGSSLISKGRQPASMSVSFKHASGRAARLSSGAGYRPPCPIPRGHAIIHSS